MKNAIELLCGALLFLVLGHAQAGGISDTGVGAYWGSDDHGYGDVIGGSVYDIQGATITRAGSVLTIAIATNFAGHAGIDANVTAKGIGYGDLFLADSWNAAGSAATNYKTDNAATGTVWDYGLVLDNRYSNTGGSFTLYQLKGATNAANIYNAESVMSCTLGRDCYYRQGQETAVKTGSSTVSNTGVKGTWTVTTDQKLTFVINLAGTELVNYTSFAMHWGETCQNDVIEGITSVTAVPEPASIALVLLGLGGLGLARRRRRVA